MRPVNPLKKTLPKAEIERLYRKYEGNISKAAVEAGMFRDTLSKLGLSMGVDAAKYKDEARDRRRPDDPPTKDEQRRLREESDRLRAELSIHRGTSGGDLNPPKWTQPQHRSQTQRLDVALLSDYHFAEVVEPEAIEWINKYDSGIAANRLRHWAEHVILLSRDYTSGTVCNGLIVPILGDMLSGIIHEELSKSNDQNILASVISASESIASAIHLLAEHYGNIFIPCVVGNHGRLTPRVSFKGAVEDNFDWLVYKMLALHFAKDKRVSVVVSSSPEYDFKIYSTTFRMSHGHEFRGGSGIIGGIYPILRGNKRKLERQSIIGRPYSHLLIGHWHQAITGVSGVICNGSIKGYDEYAYSGQFPPYPPEQVWFCVDPRHGVTISAKVHCMSDDSESWRSSAPVQNNPAWILG